MNTYAFRFKGRQRFVDAVTIFEAMVQFHALYAEDLVDLKSLDIEKIG